MDTGPKEAARINPNFRKGMSPKPQKAEDKLALLDNAKVVTDQDGQLSDDQLLEVLEAILEC